MPCSGSDLKEFVTHVSPRLLYLPSNTHRELQICHCGYQSDLTGSVVTDLIPGRCVGLPPFVMSELPPVESAKLPQLLGTDQCCLGRQGQISHHQQCPSRGGQGADSGTRGVGAHSVPEVLAGCGFYESYKSQANHIVVTLSGFGDVGRSGLNLSLHIGLT